MEAAFMRRLMLALGRRSDLRLWRQNVGSVPVRDTSGRTLRVFSSGAPKGAGDLSGYVRPEGWRLEIEVKGPRSKRSRDQEIFAQLVAAGGCVYALVAYDAAQSMAANVARGVRAVEAAIAIRRRLG